MVLAYWDSIAEILLPPVAHPQTLQVPRLGNHTQSNVSDTVTDPDILGYPQRMRPDTPPRHRLPLEAADLPVVHREHY